MSVKCLRVLVTLQRFDSLRINRQPAPVRHPIKRKAVLTVLQSFESKKG